MNLPIVFLCFSLFSFSSYAVELGVVSNQELITLQQSQQALLVDIRTPPEWQVTGTIPDSQKLQSFDKEGRFDEELWLANLQKLKKNADQPVILICRTGHRSLKVGEFLVKKGMPNVYHLQNGIESWIKSGLPVKPN